MGTVDWVTIVRGSRYAWFADPGALVTAIDSQEVLAHGPPRKKAWGPRYIVLFTM